MSITRKHQCPSCGGFLSIDNEKQMYLCTSCGSTYDYEYFREDQMQKMGDTSLERGEFNAASDAFHFILEKYPQDFSALRGLMLVSARLHNIDELINDFDPEEFSYDSGMVRQIASSASEEDKEYFTGFGKVYSDRKNLSDRYKKIGSLKDDRQKLEAKIRLTEDSRYDYYLTVKGGKQKTPRSMFITNWCFAAFFILNAVSFIFPILGLGKEEAWVLLLSIVPGLFAAGILIFNYARVLPRVRKIDEINKHIEDLNIELDRLNETIRSQKAEAEKLTASVISSCHDFVEKDRLIMKDQVSLSGSGIGTIRKHQCPSCGGGLIIDEDKQTYHCSFCGSVYDYEYFREDQMHEAGETYISRSEFMAAVDAYKFTLTKDPHDFLALRGMMLASANLPNMNELAKKSEAIEFSYDTKMVNEVIASASEDDKGYFTEFSKVYSDKKRLADCNKEIESLMQDKNNISSLVMENNIEREKNYVTSRYGTKHPPKVRFVVFGVLTGIWTLVVLFFLTSYISEVSAGTEHAEILGWLAFFHGLIWLSFVINALILLPKIIRIKRIDKAISELYAESGGIVKKVIGLEEEADKLKGHTRRSIHDLVTKDRTIMNSKRKRAEDLT